MKTLKIVACIGVFITNFAVAEVAIIVNASNDVNLDKAQITRIFLGKQHTFDSGTPAVPMNQTTDSVVRSEFEEKVLEKSTARLKKYWSKMLFSGRGTAPVEATAEEVLNKVKSDPQAIGYIDAASVTPDVKVVATF